MDINSLKEKERRASLRMGKLSQKGVKKLLREFGEACGETEYIEDYAWLNKMVVKWEKHLLLDLFGTYLTPIKEPKKRLKRRSGVAGGWIRLA